MFGAYRTAATARASQQQQEHSNKQTNQNAVKTRTTMSSSVSGYRTMDNTRAHNIHERVVVVRLRSSERARTPEWIELIALCIWPKPFYTFNANLFGSLTRRTSNGRERKEREGG